MGTLTLDSQLFPLLAQGRVVRKYLDRSVRDWTWRVDNASGEILFMEQGTGRILLSSPAKLVGTEDRQAKTFLFSWADPELHEDWGIVSGLGRLRVVARDEGLGVFDEPTAFPVARATNPTFWALSVAGFLGSAFIFEAQDKTLVRYYAVETAAEASGTTLTGQELIELFELTAFRYRFTHRAGLEAFLGKPTGRGGSTLAEETLFWTINDGQLRVILDHEGRVQELRVEKPTPLEPEPAPLPEPEPKPGLLTRLFGKRR